MTEIATVSPFEALGTNLRFGTTPDGTPFVVGSDFARAMDYRDASDAARLLDEDERGTQIVRTPGGDQRVTVFYEDGIWELIFRSSKPEAKALKKRVKEILASLRRGELAAPVPERISRRDLALMVVAEADRADAEHSARLAAERQRDELAPAAGAWDALADASGDYSARDAAHILSRDGDIEIGQNRLFTLLRELRWIGADNRPYQAQVSNGRLVSRVHRFVDDQGEVRLTHQPRITPKGLHDLRGHLLGVRDLTPQLRLAVDGAA